MGKDDKITESYKNIILTLKLWLTDTLNPCNQAFIFRLSSQTHP